MHKNTENEIQIIDTPYNLNDKSIICYPNIVYLLKVKVPRVFMKSRIVYSFITVDLVKGVAALSDIFPDYKTIRINESSLVPRLITTEKATKEARKLIIKWARHKFKVYKVPEIEVVKQQELYKAFFHMEMNNKKILVDSIKGIEINN